MNEFRCMLCGHSVSVEKRNVRTADVVQRYLERFGIDVSGYFDVDGFGLRQCCNCALASYYPARPGDDFLYQKLQYSPMYYEENKPEYDFALEILQQKMPRRVLEVGCGVGHFVRKIRDAYEVAGSEANPDAIACLRHDGIELDSASHRYDFILAFQVLEHVAEVKPFLAALVEKLETGGHLLLTVPNPEATYLREVDDVLNYPPHHMTCWNMSALENIADQFPLTKVADYFEPQRIEHHIGIIAARRRLLVGSGLYGRFMMLLGGLFDSFYAPYAQGRVEEAGHTHGIVFVKD